MAGKRKPVESKPIATPPALNERQLRFAQEYAVDLNATQAAIRAGYDPAQAGQTGHQLLKNPQIDAAVRAEMQVLADRTHVNQDFVMRGLLTNFHRAMRAEPVMDRNGPTGEYKYDGGTANRSLELMGKHIGMFGQKFDGNLNINGAPSDELSKMIGPALAQLNLPAPVLNLLADALAEALKGSA